MSTFTQLAPCSPILMSCSLTGYSWQWPLTLPVQGFLSRAHRVGPALLPSLVR